MILCFPSVDPFSAWQSARIFDLDFQSDETLCPASPQVKLTSSPGDISRALLLHYKSHCLNSGRPCAFTEFLPTELGARNQDKSGHRRRKPSRWRLGFVEPAGKSWKPARLPACEERAGAGENAAATPSCYGARGRSIPLLNPPPSGVHRGLGGVPCSEESASNLCLVTCRNSPIAAIGFAGNFGCLTVC